MDAYQQALEDFYRGELSGEAGYSALLSSARNADERFIWATLMQLETETKAWLRSAMVARGVSVEEHAADRDRGIADAEQYKMLSWTEQIQTLSDMLRQEYIPRYQEYAEAAKARGREDEQAVCAHMVEHEIAQLEFTRRQLSGASPQAALEPIVRQLKYPLAR